MSTCGNNEDNSRRNNVPSLNLSMEPPINSFDQERYRRRALMPRARRPTELMNIRHRSESPSSRQRPRQMDLHLSPSPSSIDQYDFDKIQQDLEQKNGLLRFGNETIQASMEEFTMEQCLGSGTCSVVHLARHKARPQLVMAVKQMRRSSTCHEDNKRIIKDLSVITKSFDCPSIVQCLGLFITSTEVWICMEVMSTCLDKLLKTLNEPFPEEVIGKILVSILKALEYLKDRHNTMHRDVKPSNMLLSDLGEVKLCDFGISGQLKDSIARSRQLGCIGYMAPERLETGSYDVRADIWSLGISLVELATGEFPYKGAQVEFAVMTRIISEPAPLLPRTMCFTEAFRFFIDYCLMKNCFQRPKFRQLMATEFFRRHNRPPTTVATWYQSLPHRQPPPPPQPPTPPPAVTTDPAVVTATVSSQGQQAPTATSSGYASAGSDSSPGSLGSQSRSPSASRVDPPPSSSQPSLPPLAPSSSAQQPHWRQLIGRAPALLSPRQRTTSRLQDQRILFLRPYRSSSAPQSTWLLAFESDL